MFWVKQANRIWGRAKGRGECALFTGLSYSRVAEVEAEVIQAIPRERAGRFFASKERKSGLVPSVVFEQEENGLDAVRRKRLLSVERDQIHGLVNKIGQEFFLSRTFELEVLAGPRSSHLLERGRVVPRKVHRRPGTEEILDVVFVWAPKHAKLKVDVPLVFKGEDVCPGLRKGGYLNTIKKTIEYLCPADLIPPYIDIDLSNLDIGEKLHVRDVNVHPSLKLLSGDDSFPICKIMGTRPLEAAITQS